MKLLLSPRTSIVCCAATLGLGLGPVGCSSTDTGTASSATSAPASAAAAPASATVAPGEVDRVQAYLDSIYTANDVRHSFRSAMGDTIDCPDFASAPGVRRLLAKGKSMDDIMAPILEAQKKRPAHTGEVARNVAYFQGDIDDEGNVRSCPAGTYPRVRITPERIADAGGLDRYLGAQRKVAPVHSSVSHPASAVPLDGGYQQDTGNYAWILNQFSPTDSLSSVQGGQSTMTIASPTLDAYSGDHSLAQVWLTGADGSTSIPRQTLEAGWEATSPGTAGPQPPDLFVGTTDDGYQVWCENDLNPTTSCPAWVPNPSATLALKGALPASTPGGTQHELTISIEHDYSILISCIIKRGCTETKLYRGWGISASVDGTTADTYLGYFENSWFDNDGSNGLSLGGDSFTVGAEVYDSGEKWGPPPEVTMGEGPLVVDKATYGSSAYHHDFGYFDSTNTLQTGGSTILNTNTSYVFDISTPPGNASWANYFYYGDYAP